jgi:small subunit ribosomal protein S1
VLPRRPIADAGDLDDMPELGLSEDVFAAQPEAGAEEEPTEEPSEEQPSEEPSEELSPEPSAEPTGEDDTETQS